MESFRRGRIARGNSVFYVVDPSGRSFCLENPRSGRIVVVVVVVVDPVVAVEAVYEFDGRTG
jgi:hypothetical protein